MPIEAPQAGEGTLDLGDWQLAIQSWQEIPATRQIYGEPVEVREGWKKVVIEAIAKNVSGSINFRPDVSLAGSFMFQVQADGNSYPSFDYSFPGGGWGYGSVPPGFGIPFQITVEVPEIIADYTLAVYNSDNYEPGIRLGEVRKDVVAVDFPQISPDVEIKNPDEPWQILGFATVYFNGVFMAPAWTIWNGNFEEEFASFDIQNNTGQDIKTSYSTYGDGIEMRIFLPDGRVAEGDDCCHYSEEVHDTELVPPGLRKTADFKFADDALVSEGIGGLLDVKGAVVVLFFQGQWTAWRVGAEAVEFPHIGQERQQDEYGRQLINSYINETLKSKFIPESIPEIVAQDPNPLLEDQKIIGTSGQYVVPVTASRNWIQSLGFLPHNIT